MKKAPTETEIKLTSDQPFPPGSIRNALAEICTEVRPPTPRLVRDRYLDTEDWRLYIAGAVLRVRRAENGFKAALKARTPISEGLAARPEIEEVLTEAPASETPPPLGQVVSEWLAPILADQPLRTLVEIEKQGEAFHAVSPGGLGLNVTFERVRVLSADSRPEFFEAELELVTGKVKDLVKLGKKLRERLHLAAGTTSKFDRALDMLGLDPPQLVEDGSLTLRRDDRFVDSAYRTLRRHFRRMVWFEPGTRLGLDPEYLHDMRVATRRLRAALRVFHEALPPTRADSIKRDLKWLADALGGVRDLDVHLEWLAGAAQALPESMRSAVAGYGRETMARRQKARGNMLRVLDSKRFAVFVERVGRFLESDPPARPAGPSASAAVVEAAPRLVKKRLNRVLKDGRALSSEAPDEALHALRIRFKRLRYTCEFFTDLYGGPAEKLAKRATALQDILGAHQDACVARKTLENLGTALSGRQGVDRRLGMAVGMLSAAETERARRQRAAFFKAWKRFDRKKVRDRLLTRMKKVARRK